MRIAVVISTLSSGGAERVAVILANLLTSNGHDVTIITTYSNAVDVYNTKNLKRASLAFENYNKFNSLIMKTFLLRKKLKDFDYVIAFKTFESIRVIFSCLGLKTKVVVCEHNHYYSVDSRFIRFLRNIAYIRARAVTVLTSRDVEQYPILLRSKLKVLANPLGIESIGLSFDEVKRSTLRKLNRDTITLLAVGRLTKQKDYPLMLNILSCLPVRFELVIAGTGPDEISLKELAFELGIEERVRFVGFVSNIEELYSTSSALVLTSKYEGLPMVIPEANSRALPVFSVDCPTGPRELIVHDKTGYLFNTRSPVEIASKIDSLISSPDTMVNFSWESYLLSNNYSNENFVEEFTRIAKI
ncbi:glycosyltransferase [Aliidiomarina haloalkalitolerans]|uniref:Glycosyltransferase family 4 protein n=1 Tax=Aliidiomarina haloalkalitolerans TaxID=859059 RepID=A0A432VQY4_9GAMM|nr:glycosyltransferase [Aliidiomarina haloalkalitolerans]RUO18676.1 hypothetical protein CWE06_10560 [Aliidiomarina haloalkalitolerans]